MSAAAVLPEAPSEAAPTPAAQSGRVQEEASPKERLVASGQKLLVAVIDRLAGLAVEKVDDLAGSLEGIRDQGGIGFQAMLGGGIAKLEGKNPVWGAIKGAAGAMSTTTKVVVALLLILTAVLAPVVLLVAAIVLLIVAIVAAVRSH